jgi:DnaJ-class molecular chaperone
MRDPYIVLGIKQSASADEIRAAWKTLAKSLHPDHNQNDTQANARFAEVGEAYRLLKDPETRSRYDLRRKKAEAQHKRDPTKDAASAKAPKTSAEPAVGEFLSNVWRKMSGKVNSQDKAKAPDLVLELEITIEDIMGQARPTITLPDGKALRISLPEGLTDGKQVRITGQGHRIPGMKQGDVIVTFRLARHPVFRPEGLDLYTKVPIDIENAVLGCETIVDAPDGPIKIQIPEWTSSDHVIRVKGRGLPGKSGERGDLLAEIRIMLWDHPDEKVKDLMRSLREGLFL